MAHQPMRALPTNSAIGVTVQGLLYPMPENGAQDKKRLETLSRVSRPVADRLYESLQLIRTPAGQMVSNLGVFRCHEESLAQLEDAQAQLNNLISTVCSTQVRIEGTFSQSKLEETLESELKLMTSGLEKAQISTEIHASLADQPVSEIRETLLVGLQAATTAVVLSFYRALDRLVDRRVIGLLDWSSPNSCRFHYFERCVRQTVNHRSFEWQTTQSDFSTVDEELEVSNKTNTWVLQRHTHNITNTTQCKLADIDRSDLVIPLRLRPLLASIPRWLSPSVSIVDGELISESVEESNIRKESFVERVFTGKAHVNNRVHYDPAVMLDGLFVLSGWNLDEHQSELQRTNASSIAKHQRQLFETADQATWYWLCRTSIAGLIASYLFPIGGSSQLIAILGVTTWGIGLHAAYQMHCQRVLARRATASFIEASKCPGAYVGITAVLTVCLSQLL